MTQTTNTICQGCGRREETEPGNRPRGWLFMEVQINGNKGKTEVDVCDWSCMADYSSKEHRKKTP